jgi:hypothetical protein
MFPGSSITTGFGWDKMTFPKAPRIHHAIDRAGKGNIFCPIDAGRVKWLDEDSNGCSVLRLIGDGIEIRMLHFIKDEVNPAVMDAVANKSALAISTVIGPAGNKGQSVSTVKGGSGRHLHYQTMLEPGVHDRFLASVRADWDVDNTKVFTAQYGKLFTAEVKKRGIWWMNDYVIFKHDAISASEKYVIDSTVFFNL